MVYLHEKHVGDAARKIATRPRPMGAGLNDAADVEVVEVWCSDFLDPGDDFNDFRIYNAQGELLRTVRINGY
jgi:hypothetical protein